jgi:hypothetical protein
MAVVSFPESAGAANWLSVQPQSWPPPVPGPHVLLVAISELRQQSAAGFLPLVQPGRPFWCEPRAAPLLIASGQAVIPPPGTVLAPEPPLTANGISGLGAGTSNASR